MTREQKVFEIINNLHLISTDIIPIITEYQKPVEYSRQPINSLELPRGSRPRGIVSDQKFLYFCDYVHDHLRVYDLKYQEIEINSPYFRYPSDIDFSENHLYIIDEEKISIFNLQFQETSSFQIPSTKFGRNHIKVDQNLIYVTIAGHHQVFVYTREGNIKYTIGTTSSSLTQGNFKNPSGLTLTTRHLYISDKMNHRIQALRKNADYSFSHMWGKEGNKNGQFYYPSSICYGNEILFVCDSESIQLFSFGGIFLQKIGQLSNGGGMCAVGDQLYVSDGFNSRIQVFERMVNSDETEDLVVTKKEKNECIIH